MNSTMAISVGAAVAIVLVNFVLAYQSSRKTMKKTGKDFLSTALMGMGLRMVFMVVMVVVVAMFVPVDLRTFGFALVAGLILGLIIEIVLLKKMLRHFTSDSAGE